MTYANVAFLLQALAWIVTALSAFCWVVSTGAPTAPVPLGLGIVNDWNVLAARIAVIAALIGSLSLLPIALGAKQACERKRAVRGAEGPDGAVASAARERDPVSSVLLMGAGFGFAVGLVMLAAKGRDRSPWS